MCSGLYYVCTGFWPHHRSLCSDTLLIFSYSNLKSLLRTNRKGMHRHTNDSRYVLVHLYMRTRAHAHPLKSIWSWPWLLICSVILFPLQMTASTREMSGFLRQCCLASSNICQVLGSSLLLRRAVSQESRLLTRKTAKAAQPSALKHIPFACSFASLKDCVKPTFVVFKACSHWTVKFRALHNGVDSVWL